MAAENRLFDKLFQVIPGPVFGLLSVFVGVCGDILSALHKPGYNISRNMISELGVGNGAIFFNIGVILAGILAIPFMVYLERILIEQHDVSESQVRLALIGSIISSIALSLIGIFPADLTNITMLWIHGTIAAICYFGAICYLIIYGLLMRKDDRFSDFFAYYGIINAGLFVVVLLTWNPLFQWIANICIILWTVLVSSTLLYKKI